MSALYFLARQKLYPPEEITDPATFRGRTVLITGATTGLGQEAAKKVVAKGAKKLIFTARDTKRGENTLRMLQDVAKSSSSKTEVTVMSLNMSKVDSVKAFAKEIEAKHSDLDTAILNAGTIYTEWTKSADGFEEIIQVNTVSTTLLGILLLPLLERNSTPDRPAHLTFVSSGTAVRVSARDLSKFASTEVVSAMSDEKNWPGAQGQYARSKLLLEYTMRRIASLPRLRDQNGQFKVIVNSTCPGMCFSDLGRQFQKNILLAFAIWAVFSVFARTTEQGSRSYISAINQGSDSQGQLWKDDQFFDGGEMIGTPKGDELANATWNDMVHVLEDADPRVRDILEGK